MASNLFFPDNVKRYDRMKQLLNDVTAIRGLALGQITSQADTTDRLDITCKNLMDRAGFKNLQELHDSVLKTLPDVERDRYLSRINRLKKFDEVLANASVYIGVIGSSALALSIPLDKTVLMIDLAHDVGGRAAWCRGFRKFWTGSPIQGWREMSQARRLMAENAQEVVGWVGQAAPRAMRAARILRVVGEVMETIAKWCFILEIAILWLQYHAEEDQKFAMQNAIKNFYYNRFSMQEQLMEVMATTSLYTALDGYLLTKDAMEKSKASADIIASTLKTMADTIITAHAPDVAKITDDTVWAACDAFDTRAAAAEKVYTTDDPPKDQARDWLKAEAEKAAKEDENEKAQKVADSLEKAKDDEHSKLGLPI